MADSTAYLEKMGRELKCPICLSLMKSAVSLTCNHVFCNLCIVESMKSDSHCPVCKVPFQRREVRSAPHMDNLVNIYKSMEAASGLNIFVTQNAPAIKQTVPEAGKNQGERGKDSGRHETGGSSHGKRKKKRKSKKKTTKEVVKTDERIPDSQNSMNPSFPAKKRVHVPQGNPFETPVRHRKCQEKLGNQAEKGPTAASVELKEQHNSDAKKESGLLPFFWLRDEDENDEDRLTNQQMDIDFVTDSPTQNVPSFSDIKDTNDRIPTKTSPNGKVSTPSKLVGVYDSEMFEWTQTACSPEIFSTPVKDKDASKGNLDTIQEHCEANSQVVNTRNREEPVSDNANDVSCGQGNGETYMKLVSSKRANDTKVQSTQKLSNNQSKKVRRNKRKRAKVSADKVLSADKVPGEVLESVSQGSNLGSKLPTNVAAPNPRKKMKQSNKTASSNTKTVKGVAEEVSCPSNEVGVLKQKNKNMSAGLHGKTSGTDGSLKHKTKNSMKCVRKHQKSDSKNFKNQTADTVMPAVLEEILINQNSVSETVKNQVSLLPCSNKSKTSVKENKSITHKRCIGKLRENRRLTMSNGDVAEGGMVSVGKTQTIPVHKEDSEIKIANKSEPTKKVLSAPKTVVLQKCGSVHGPNICAFCQSSTDSEASGNMMHYFNGRPVAPDFNGESNIIHAHKSCTEWAPNVYFEDDIAINLESELTRSRRIKCSCCGIKGASLGCYEKSCRKSFHVTCAKLVPECRWDAENFVMLCPLHPSSKLPKEIFGSQKKKQKQINPRRESEGHQAKVTAPDSVNARWLLKGVYNKWVLCCSGLTDAEKEVVSQFTKMAGVQLLKTYGPSVTHVIASTDDNGACKRTLKVLMGILEGKWILKIDWVKACMKAMEPVAEDDYDINVDIHGVKNGPRLGRQRVLNKKPKLFDGCNFFFMGEFAPSYKGDLQDLVVAAGGTVLQRKPISGDACVSTTFIIYNGDLPDDCESGKKKILCNGRRDEAEALAILNEAKVAAHTWLLDSIAACKLQAL